MGVWDRIKKAVKKGYTKVDAKVFKGKLPGGAPSTSTKKTVTPKAPTPTKTSTPTKKTPSKSSGGSSSRSSGRSSVPDISKTVIEKIKAAAPKPATRQQVEAAQKQLVETEEGL